MKKKKENFKHSISVGGVLFQTSVMSLAFKKLFLKWYVFSLKKKTSI